MRPMCRVGATREETRRNVPAATTTDTTMTTGGVCTRFTSAAAGVPGMTVPIQMLMQNRCPNPHQNTRYTERMRYELRYIRRAVTRRAL